MSKQTHTFGTEMTLFLNRELRNFQVLYRTGLFGWQPMTTGSPWLHFNSPAFSGFRSVQICPLHWTRHTHTALRSYQQSCETKLTSRPTSHPQATKPDTNKPLMTILWLSDARLRWTRLRFAFSPRIAWLPSSAGSNSFDPATKLAPQPTMFWPKRAKTF